MNTSTLIIDVASPTDAPDVARIGRITFYETWREVNTEEDMQLYLKTAFDEDKIREDVSDSKINLFLLARKENSVIGYSKMRRDRTYDEFKGMKAIEIERIYVKKEYQNKKFGKGMMDRCIEIAREEGCHWLWLAVNTENKTAITFYKKYGFEIFGTKYFKLGTAEDEDYLMKLKLIEN